MTTEQYINLISKEPLPEMIEQGNGYRYIKKSVLKRELLDIYGGHTKFEVVDKVISKNGLYGSGLLHYKHPVSGEWLYESGMAAIPHDRQMKLNYPNLKAAIFKNAAKEIGVWFGQTLNLHIDDAELEEVAVTDTIESDRVTDIQWEKVKKKLATIKNKEDAQTYLDTTDFNMTVAAKQIINSKKSKHETKKQ